jgi:hypothetical protein
MGLLVTGIFCPQFEEIVAHPWKRNADAITNARMLRAFGCRIMFPSQQDFTEYITKGQRKNQVAIRLTIFLVDKLRV